MGDNSHTSMSVLLLLVNGSICCHYIEKYVVRKCFNESLDLGECYLLSSQGNAMNSS